MQPIAVALLLWSLIAGIQPAQVADQQCFTETGQCVSGVFLAYWRDHGALTINGFPITGEFDELMEDGNTYRVQYFERSRLEYHPENPVPYDVLLGQFGRYIHPLDPPMVPGGERYFTETGHNLAGRFREYWEQNGGLAQFGYPLTEPLDEQLEDGKPYTVQYFERARFELHGENRAPYDVLLGKFGLKMLIQRTEITSIEVSDQPELAIASADRFSRTFFVRGKNSIGFVHAVWNVQISWCGNRQVLTCDPVYNPFPQIHWPVWEFAGTIRDTHTGGMGQDFFEVFVQAHFQACLQWEIGCFQHKYPVLDIEIKPDGTWIIHISTF